jgi:membrane-associated phospholipid phosphatase
MVVWITLLPTFIKRLDTKKWRITLNLIAYAWLLIVALSRVYMGAHFPSDVLTGAAIALGSFGLFKRCLLCTYSLSL